MSTPHLFRFYLMKDATQYYYWDGQGVATTTDPRNIGAQPEAGTQTPDGWEATELKWGRNIDYRSVMRSFSTPYRFIKDGAQILRYISYTQGIEGICKLVIKKRRSDTWGFDNYYSGDLDFSTFIDDIVHCTCEIVEGGLSAKLKAYANTPQEIKLSGPNVMRVYSDGITLVGTFNYFNSKSADVGGPISNANAGDTFSFWSNILPTEGDYPIAFNQRTVATMVMANYANTRFTTNKEQYSLESLQTLRATGRLKQKFIITSPSLSPFTFSVDMIVGDDANSAFISRQSLYRRRQPSGYTDPNVVFDLDLTSTQVTLNEGQRIYFIWWIENELTFDKIVNFDEGKISIETVFRLAPSTSLGMRFVSLLSGLADGVSDHSNTLQSTFLSNPNYKIVDNRPYWTIATCGDALRGFVGRAAGAGSSIFFDPPAIKTSLTECLKSLFSIYPVGLGVEGEKLVLEHISYFFDANTLVYDLGEVIDLKIVPAEEYYASTLRIGYEDQTYDGLNGKYEPNTGQAYKMPTARKPDTADFVSQYRADPTGMEIDRANLSNKKTTDAASDNDTFLISVSSVANADGSYTVDRPQNNVGSSVTGMPFPETFYNYDLTPKHNLIRQSIWLAMMTYLQGGKKITFQTTDKNPDVVTNLGTGTIIEKSDVDVSSLGKLPFLPVYIQCQLACDNINEILSSYPKGYFKMTYYGIPVMGFLDSAGVRPAKLDKYSFQFLAHPDMDIPAVAAAMVKKQG